MVQVCLKGKILLLGTGDNGFLRRRILCALDIQLEKDQFWSWQDFDFIFQLKIQPLAPHFFFLVGEEDDHDQSEALE